MVASLNACATHCQAHLRAYLGSREHTSIKPNCTIGSVIARYTGCITACLLNPTTVYSEWKYTGYPDNSESYLCVVTLFFNGCSLISYVKKKKIKCLATFIPMNAIKHFSCAYQTCTEVANLEVDLLFCWPALVQLEYIRPMMNFKCHMQRERAKTMKIKHQDSSCQCCGSGSERCPAEALPPAVTTTTSLAHQSLATYTKTKQLSTSKNHTHKGWSGSPSHTRYTLTLCKEC